MKALFVLLYGTCIFLSCKTAYVPNTVNVPLFDDSGQFRVSGDLGGNVQLAASLGRNFAVMANGMWKREGEKSSSLYGQGGFAEIGIGGFSRSSSLIKYEAYIGGGAGKSETHENNKSFEAKGARFFFQPSIGIHHSIFEVAFTPRLVAGKFQKPTTNYTAKELIDNKLSNIDEPTWAFLEPAITARVGFQWLKLQLQIGNSIKLTDKPLAYTKEFNSLGIIFDLGRKY